MDEIIAPMSFEASIYGEPTPINNLLTQRRIRIFHKGLNTNMSVFVDNVSEELIKSMAGAPVIGKFDEEAQDFSSHLTIKETKAYGFVPLENYNFAWEPFTEQDGTVNEYATMDVHLWTGRYPEAKFISGKKQSMELYGPTIQGRWEVLQGKKVFVYTSAQALGLCVLGDDVQPCFDGAQFFEAEAADTIKLADYFSTIRNEIAVNFSLQHKSKEDEVKLNIIRFGNWDEELNTSALEVFNALNPDFSEKGIIDNYLMEITQENIVAYDLNTLQFTRYILAEGENTPNFTVSTGAYVASNHGPQWQIFQETDTSVLESDLAAAKTALEAEIAKYEASELTIAEQKTAIEAMTAANENFAATVAGLKAALDKVEQTNKEALIDSYTSKLDEEVIESVRENMSNYSLTELEGELAVTFSRNYVPKSTKLIPGDPKTESTDPVLNILKKYQKQ